MKIKSINTKRPGVMLAAIGMIIIAVFLIVTPLTKIKEQQQHLIRIRCPDQQGCNPTLQQGEWLYHSGYLLDNEAKTITDRKSAMKVFVNDGSNGLSSIPISEVGVQLEDSNIPQYVDCFQSTMTYTISNTESQKTVWACVFDSSGIKSTGTYKTIIEYKPWWQ